jgi:altronate hydrolase
MDTPGYDPVGGDRPGGGRRQRPRLHHRPRLGLWLQADALDQARHQHDIYERMIDDMDINCGDILDGVSLEEKGREIFEEVISRWPRASGRSRRSSATATTSSCPGRSAR